MRLLGLSEPVWRTVEVTALADAVYRIEGPMPQGETWQFEPGSLVRLGWRKFEDGQERLVPTSKADSAKGAFSKFLKLNTALILGALPYAVLFSFLPREAGGRIDSPFYFLGCLALILVAAIALVRLKYLPYILKNTLRSNIGFGALFIFGMLLDR